MNKKSPLKFVEATSSVTKQKLSLVPELMAWVTVGADGSTHIYYNGGAACPVVESPSVITERMAIARVFNAKAIAQATKPPRRKPNVRRKK